VSKRGKNPSKGEAPREKDAQKIGRDELMSMLDEFSRLLAQSARYLPHKHWTPEQILDDLARRVTRLRSLCLWECTYFDSGSTEDPRGTEGAAIPFPRIPHPNRTTRIPLLIDPLPQGLATAESGCETLMDWQENALLFVHLYELHVRTLEWYCSDLRKAKTRKSEQATMPSLNWARRLCECLETGIRAWTELEKRFLDTKRPFQEADYYLIRLFMSFVCQALRNLHEMWHQIYGAADLVRGAGTARSAQAGGLKRRNWKLWEEHERTYTKLEQEHPNWSKEALAEEAAQRHPYESKDEMKYPTGRTIRNHVKEVRAVRAREVSAKGEEK